MMRVRRPLTAALALMLCLIASGPVLAQDGVPHPNPRVPTTVPDAPSTATRTDLAAIALASEDVPDGYALGFEAYLGGDDIASQLFGDEVSEATIAEVGLLWYYESQYEAADGLSRIRTYVEEFESEASVERGFEVLEDEDRLEGPGVEIDDRRGLRGVGEEPSEVTTFVYEESAGSAAGVTIDATFRVGNLLVGVAIDVLADDEPDEELLTELAERVAERAETVIAGDDLPGIDAHLSAGLLEYGDALVIQEGYLTLAESLGAEPDPAMDADYESGYVRMVVLGMDVNPDLPLPFVTTSVYRFGSESAALGYLTNLEAVTPAYAELARFDVDRIPGTSAARALSFANPYESAGPDSLLIAATIDELVLTIEVVGAGSLDQAEATAVALIAQQVPCVAAGNACGTAVLPAGFSAAEG